MCLQKAPSLPTDEQDVAAIFFDARELLSCAGCFCLIARAQEFFDIEGLLEDDLLPPLLLSLEREGVLS